MAQAKSSNQTSVVAIVVVGLVVTLFWRGIDEAFDLVKASVLWTGTLCLLILQVGDFRSFRSKHTKTFSVATALFCGILILGLFFSTNPWVSFWGQQQRYTGVLTLVCLLALGLIVSVQMPTSIFSWNRGFVVMLATVTLYGTLQYLELDPFEWQTTGFGSSVFGLSGNPNTSSATIAVLLPFAIPRFGLKHSNPIRVFLSLSLFFAGLSLIEVFDSFQANIAIFVSTCLIVTLTGRQNESTSFNMFNLLLIIGSIVLPTVNLQASLRVLVIFIFSVAGTCVFQRNFSVTVAAKRKPFIVSGFGFLIVAAMLGRRTWILENLRSGFSERGDFLRAGYRIFLDSPVVGHGLQSYGAYFTRFRPQSHAENLEFSRSSSVHNVFFGFIVDGGVLLGLVLVLFVVLLWFIVIRSIRRNFVQVDQLPLLASWVSLQVMFLVTVEHIVLLTLFFVLSGLIVQQFGRQEGFKPSVRGSRIQRRGSPVVLMTAVVVSALVSLVSFWLPIRSSLAARASLVSNSAGEKLFEAERSTALAPWNSTNWARRADAELQTGRYAEAVESATRALESSAYSPPLPYSAAVVFVEVGRFELAVETVSKGITQDPHAPKYTSDLLSLLRAIDQSANESGDSNLLAKIAEVVSDFPEALRQEYRNMGM